MDPTGFVTALSVEYRNYGFYVLKELKQAEEVEDGICYFVSVDKIETLIVVI